MSGETYYRIDNKGRGNCGYLSYAISLMYILRHKQDEDLNDRILDGLLKLEKEDSDYLKKLLKESRQNNRIFTGEELSRIQDILGQTIRNFAADAVINEYRKTTATSQIFAVTTYPIMVAFKAALNDKDINSYEPNEQVDDLVNSELFRLPNFNTEIRKFYTAQKVNFNRLFQENVALLAPTKRTATNKIKIFEGLIKQLTKDFLETNRLLEAYYSRLSTNGVWASEDTILCMHRALINEKMSGDEGHRSMESENDITFSIARNGLKMSGDNVDILLNNESNIHWTSLVPGNLIADVSEDMRPKSCNFRLQTFAKSASGFDRLSTMREDLFPNIDTYDIPDVEKQRELLEYYAKRKKQVESRKDILRDVPTTYLNAKTKEWQNISTNHSSSDEVESLRKQLSYLALIEGQRANPIANQIKALLDKQVTLNKSLESTMIEIHAINTKISSSSVNFEEKSSIDVLESKRFELYIKQKQLEHELQSNNEFVMQLLAIEEAEAHTPASPVVDLDEQPQLSYPLQKDILQQTETGFTASLLLQLFQSACKNIFILAVATIAGFSSGMLFASTVGGIPAAIGLGVATTTFTGVSLLSIFNLGKDEIQNNVPSNSFEY